MVNKLEAKLKKQQEAIRDEALIDRNAMLYFKSSKELGEDESNCKDSDLYLQGLEETRRDALTGRSGVDYVNLCQEAGIGGDDCEAPDLYQQGLVDVIQEETSSARLDRQLSTLETQVSALKKSGNQRKKAIDFLKAVDDYGVNVYGSFAADADSKRELLLEHFPGRFGAGRKQDLSRYDDVQVGAMFRNIVSGYEKRYSQ
ncbi:hypothetical protein J4434_04710 [Candidatus Woesearchaeota archaeon]|nr:hypothetical protein [Candidatus Woesearchaeota archaeon]